MMASSSSSLHRVSEKNWTLCYFIISLLELELTNEIEFTNEIVLLRDVREVKSTESGKVFQTLTVRCAKKMRRVLHPMSVENDDFRIPGGGGSETLEPIECNACSTRFMHVPQGSAVADKSPVFQELPEPNRACLVGHVTWHTESYRNLTLAAFGRCLVYQVT